MSGIDGIRQDTWPYVPRAFWRDWMTAIRREYPSLKVVGEVFDGDPSLVSFFQGGRTQFDGIDDKVDTLFDFPLFYPDAARVRRRQVAPRGRADARHTTTCIPNPSSLMTFLGLHDVAALHERAGRDDRRARSSRTRSC